MTGAKPGFFTKLVIPAAVGLVTGAVVAFAAHQIFNIGAGEPHDVSTVVAVCIGLLYVAVGIGLGAGTVVPRLGARFLNVEDAGELREQRAQLARSATAMGLIGAFLITVAVGGPGQSLPPLLSAAMAAAFALAGIILGWGGMARADELLRQVSLEGTYAGFNLILAIGGGWAALAHLGLAAPPAPPAPLDWLSLFAVMMLAGAFIASGRRGMLAPR